MRRFGYRNIVFVAGILLLVLYASLPVDGDPAGRGMERSFRIFLWMTASLAFFAVNAVLVGAALTKQRPVAKPLIACLLAMLSGVMVLAG